MGQLEIRSRRRVRRGKLQRIILESVATAGILSVALVAPNVLKSMKKLGVLPKFRQKEYVSSTASKLVRRGLMRFVDGHYEMTHLGEKILTLWRIDNYKFNKPKRWDRKWRMIIFDIPEKKKKTRKQISGLFGQAGMYRLQDSVWIFPYDCEDIIGLLKTEFRVGKDVLYVIADEIENDKYLRSHFDL
ncbi:MAG: hypothetical protein AABY40_00130 [Nanoarchaeota archaeon]